LLPLLLLLEVSPTIPIAQGHTIQVSAPLRMAQAVVA